VKARQALWIAACGFFFGGAAPAQTVIPLAQEPHHHLALHNEYVNVYQVEVAPHDAVLLHRHDADAISVMMSDAEVTVRAPGKPDVRQKLVDGQIRLQARGYVHATAIEGETTYRNVTVELLLPQEGGRNLCAAVLAAQALHCPPSQEVAGSAGHVDQPQYETKETSVTLVRVLAYQKVSLGDSGSSELIIALDPAIARTGGNVAGKLLRPGDFVWLASGETAEVFRNEGGKEARLVSFVLKPKR
jgi:hypothetical protein